MTKIVRVIALGILGLSALPAPAVAGSLDTRVTMLIGSPASGDARDSVLVVPGAVIPVALADRGRTDVTEDSAWRAEMMQDLADKLRRATGLESVEIAYSEVFSVGRDQTRALRGPGVGSALRGELTLIDFNDDLAVYRVQVWQGSERLADSKVAVERGRRAVVGGLDGEEAPYFFLIIEAATRALFVKGDIVPPRKMTYAPPKYTEEARKERLQGLVILQAVIDEQGRVGEIEVLKGLPLGLTETAIEALRQWTFEPATLEGEPVAVYYNLTFNFRLSKEKKAGEEPEKDAAGPESPPRPMP